MSGCLVATLRAVMVATSMSPAILVIARGQGGSRLALLWFGNVATTDVDLGLFCETTNQVVVLG